MPASRSGNTSGFFAEKQAEMARAALEGKLRVHDSIEAIRASRPAFADAGDAAGAMRAKVETSLVKVRDVAFRLADETVGGYAARLRGGYDDVERSAQALKDALEHPIRTPSSEAAQRLRAQSPPGPLSPLHHIDDWGEKTAMASGDGFARAPGSDRREGRQDDGLGRREHGALTRSVGRVP